MNHRSFGPFGPHDRWADDERQRAHHPGGHGPWDDPRGPGGRAGHGPRGHRGGPPPWVAEFFGWGGERRRGPRVRRGDVRTAVLDVLREAGEGGETRESPNGYQVIQRIAERTDQAWRPSPGSVYPTIAQLQDEGLVEEDGERGQRALRLTDAGRAWVAEHAEELDAVWAPFADDDAETPAERGPDVKEEIGKLMSAVWQVTTQGSDAQRRAGLEILVDARKRLYGVLADDDA